VPLVGLATEKPIELARKFARKHRLSVGAQIELRRLISCKIKQYLSDFKV